MLVHKKKNYGHAGYVDDPLPNIVYMYMAILMPTCIVWLDLLCIQLDYIMVVSGQFFFCLVCGPLEK